MAYEPKPNDFSIFKNERKGTEKAPDYTGTGLVQIPVATINKILTMGAKRIPANEIQAECLFKTEAAFWKKTAQSGINFLSGKLSEPYQGGGKGGKAVDKDDEDVPF